MSVLALGMALSASAQSVQNGPVSASESAVVDSGPGLVGTNYSQLSFGYQKQEGEPSDLRDYQLLSNGAVYKNGEMGVDANFMADHIAGSADGFSDRRDMAQMGLTGFLMEPWGKPFITCDAGMAWQRAADVSRKSYAYTGIGGIEFQVMRNLALSPFVEYQAEPHLYNHEELLANFPDHMLDYGVNADLRIDRSWNASVGADLDQHSDRDWGLRGGVSYHF
jgi:hypothetical protein